MNVTGEVAWAAEKNKKRCAHFYDTTSTYDQCVQKIGERKIRRMLKVVLKVFEETTVTKSHLPGTTHLR